MFIPSVSCSQSFLKSIWRDKEADDLAVTGIPTVDPKHEHSDFSTGYGEPRFPGAMRVLQQLNQQPCERFVDLGCGTGKVSLSYFRGSTLTLGLVVVRTDRVGILSGVSRRE